MKKWRSPDGCSFPNDKEGKKKIMEARLKECSFGCGYCFFPLETRETCVDFEDTTWNMHYGCQGKLSYYPTRPNSSPFAKNTELVNPPESVYRICNLCSDYSTKCGGIFGTNLLQKTPPSANAEFFLSSANAEFWGGAKKEKKIVSSWARTRFLKLARHRSTHYSTPPFIPIEVFYRLYIQKQYFFSS